MKNEFKILEKLKGPGMNQAALKGGTYSITITAIVLAIVIVVNIFAQALPSHLTQYDISSTKLYSITSNTKVVVNALEEDVTIYWVVQSGEEDDVIEKLLDKYDSLSEHLEVVKKNPDIYPTFAQQYTTETVSNNSLIVECGDRSRFISYSDIYLSSGSMYSSSSSTSFDGEGAITSAIDYVVNSEQPQLYILEGHGEEELSSTFSEQIEKENMETNTFSLLNSDSIPEEADCVLINAPTSDISTEEKELLEKYIADGGKLFVMAGPAEDDELPNLYSLLSDYGVESEEGIVIDMDREYYAFQMPYILMPNICSDEITDPLIEEKYHAIVPISKGLTVGETPDGVTVTELLTTSDESYSKKAGYNLTSYEKEEGDVDGPFALAVSIENANEGQVVWIASSHFVDDMYNEYSSGANLDLVMNAVSSMVGESDAVSIRSKSLKYSYLTISDSTASLLKFVMIGVFPLLYLMTGIGVTLKRRKNDE
ncbi:GldG family protein [Roseburia hominis]